MVTKKETETSSLVYTRDARTGEVKRIAFPHDVQIGLASSPQELMLTGRLSLSAENYKIVPGTTLTLKNDVVYANVEPTNTSISGDLNVVLPPKPRQGQLVVVKDASGTAETHNIVVKAQSGITIDSTSSQTIVSPYGAISIIWNGNEWAGSAGQAGGSTPGGPDKQVQFNKKGKLGYDSTFTYDSILKSLKVTNLSGSLTRLSDGTPYLKAGPNITLMTESNGSISITGSAGGGSPGGLDTYVQYNNAGSFAGSSNFTFDGTAVYLTASFSQGISSNASGLKSHAEGYYTNAQGDYAHSEGELTYAQGKYSHAEGTTTFAVGQASHAEGSGAVAIGNSSHAEGTSVASGFASHAEGQATEALNDYAHSEGYYTHASGAYSHTAGVYTIASGSGQNVVGKYNKRNNTDSLFIIGNGSGDLNSQRDDIFLVNSGSVLIGSASLASDTFFHVGTKGAANTSLFAGNVHASGTVKSTSGFSGSLTKLVDGTPYLIAGSGISIATGSNGAVTITNDGTVGDITAVTAGIGLSGGGTSGAVTLDINDAVVATVSGTTFTGVTKHNAGLSGSLTKLVDGTSYLIAGSNVSITSGSNGSVTISSTGGGGGTPGGADTNIQYNSLGTFAGSTSFTFDGGTVFLTGSLSQGNTSYPTGLYSHAEGSGTTAEGISSHSEGISTKAFGDFSHAEGGYAASSGSYSHAEGYGTTAWGDGSHAEGLDTVASGTYSHAEGRLTLATGSYSHAEGHLSAASGSYSHAEGYGTIASGSYSHSEGYETLATGDYSHAEGHTTVASGERSHAEGSNNVASGPVSHAEGSNNTAAGTFSHAEGNGTEALNDGSHSEGYQTSASGSYSHSEGYRTITTGSYSHAEGYLTIASGSYSHSEGNETVALELGSHSEGYLSVASGSYSHAEGYSAIASGSYSHAEGYDTLASGDYSHSEGYQTVASGERSHAEGSNNTASGPVSHAEGSNNTASGTFSHAEGNGTVAVDDGAHSEGYQTLASGSYSHAEGYQTAASGSSSHSEGYLTVASGSYSHAEGYITFASGSYSHSEGYETVALSDGAHSEGYRTAASGTFAHSEGYQTIASGSYSHSEGHITIALGTYSHAEGGGTSAQGAVSHSEGMNTIAVGNGSHAEGNYSISFGNNSHAEGEATQAVGFGSHAEGSGSISVGDYSHAAGLYTIASGTHQSVVGKYNKRNNTDSIFVVGYGSGDTDPERDDIFLVNSGSVMVGSGTLDPDTFFYVGTIPSANKSLFKGSVFVSGTTSSELGFSGSLTKLVDGTSYLLAGSGISITTGSNGAVTITNDGTVGDITAVNAGTGLSGGGTSGAVTLNINDAVVATVSGTTFTGATKHNAGLSGSLTQLVDGSSYLIAGSGISITSASNGAVTITSTTPTWQSYTPNLTGSVSNPTLPTTNYLYGKYIVDGKLLKLIFNASWGSTTGAAAGSGNYLIPLPVGYTIDTTIALTGTLGLNYLDGISLATAQISAYSVAAGGAFAVVPASTTQLLIIGQAIGNTSQPSVWGSNFFDVATFSNFRASFVAEIPIV